MTFEDAVDLDQRPSIKKRVLVAGLLGLAAIGTHWLPARTIVPNATDLVAGRTQAVAAATPAKLVTGPNSLLGDSIADPTAQLLASADVCQAHLDADTVIDQAGLSRLLNGVAPIRGEFGTSASDATAEVTAGEATAVPEPRTAGLLLLAAAPVFIRRRVPRRAMA